MGNGEEKQLKMTKLKFDLEWLFSEQLTCWEKLFSDEEAFKYTEFENYKYPKGSMLQGTGIHLGSRN